MTQGVKNIKKQDDEGAFEPISATRTSERVALAICRAIIQGRFPPGAALPTERRLANRFRVTRNTVREALKSLEQSRLISIRQGSGVRVLDYLASAGLEFVAELLDARVSDRQVLLRDIVEARTVLGQAMCHHAIDHLETEDIDPLVQAIEDLATAAGCTVQDPRVLQQQEFQIHNLLIAAGNNHAFLLLHNSLRHVFLRTAHLFEQLVADPVLLAADYRAMAAALRCGDREAAKRALSAALLRGAKGYDEAPR